MADRIKYFASVEMTVEVLAETLDDARAHVLLFHEDLKRATTSERIFRNPDVKTVSSFCFDDDIDIVTTKTDPRVIE